MDPDAIYAASRTIKVEELLAHQSRYLEDFDMKSQVTRVPSNHMGQIVDLRSHIEHLDQVTKQGRGPV